MSALLVLDEHFMNPRLVLGLKGRGMSVQTLKDFGVLSLVDPDQVLRIDRACARTWVLVTKDYTIIEDHRGFAWQDFSIAWIELPPGVRGEAEHHHKHDLVHHFAKRIRGQGRGDHVTYREWFPRPEPPSVARVRRKL